MRRGPTGGRRAVRRGFSLGLVALSTIPLTAALSSLLAAHHIGGMQLSGFLWPLYFVGGILYILGRKGERVRFPVLLWLPWALYAWFAVFWTDAPLRFAVQNAFQITTPLVVAAAASVAVRHEGDLRRFLRSFTLGLLALAAIIAVGLLPSLMRGEGMPPGGTAGFAERPAALTLVVIAAVAATNPTIGLARRLLAWGGCLLLAFATGGRMATLAILAGWIVAPGRTFGRRLLVTMLVIAIGVGIFYTPHFQARTFGTSRGTIGDALQGRMDTAGRLDGEEALWQHAWDWAAEHIVFGGGSASLQTQMHHKPVNDYLRVLADYGVMGLLLLMLGLLIQLYMCWQGFRAARAPILRWGWGAATTALGLFLLVTLTENSMTYSLYLQNPIFALIGGAHGVTERILAPPAAPPPTGIVWR